MKKLILSVTTLAFFVNSAKAQCEEMFKQVKELRNEVTYNTRFNFSDCKMTYLKSVKDGKEVAMLDFIDNSSFHYDNPKGLFIKFSDNTFLRLPDQEIDVSYVGSTVGYTYNCYLTLDDDLYQKFMTKRILSYSILSDKETNVGEKVGMKIQGLATCIKNAH